MTGSNHLVAGALIAATVTQPMVAIPLAFMSHFFMDAMPHYGDTNERSWLSRNFKYILALDAVIGLSFLIAVMVLQPLNWGLIVACAIIAVLPDALWVPYFLADIKHEYKQPTKVARFLKWIQWGERPWGIYLELILLIYLLAVFWQIVR